MSKDLKYFQEPNGTSERPRGKAACKNMGWGNQIKTVPKQIGQIWGDICPYEAKCGSFNSFIHLHMKYTKNSKWQKWRKHTHSFKAQCVRRAVRKIPQFAHLFVLSSSNAIFRWFCHFGLDSGVFGFLFFLFSWSLVGSSYFFIWEGLPAVRHGPINVLFFCYLLCTLSSPTLF